MQQMSSSSEGTFRVVPLTVAYRHRAAKCMSVGHMRETLARSGNFSAKEMLDWAYEQVDAALEPHSQGLSFVALTPSKASSSSIESNCSKTTDCAENEAIGDADADDSEDVVGLCTSHDFGIYYPRLAQHVQFYENLTRPLLLRLSQGESQDILNEREVGSNGCIDTSYEDAVITSFMLALLNRFIQLRSLSHPPPLHSFLYVDLLCVLPSACNMGIGTALVSSTLAAAEERKFHSVVSLLSSFYSQPLFLKKFGFECIDEWRYADFVYFNHRPNMFVNIKDTPSCKLVLKTLIHKADEQRQQKPITIDKQATIKEF